MPWGIWGAGRGTQGKCAKQTQFAAERRERQILYGKRVMVNWTSKGLGRNKANSRRCRGGRCLRGRRRRQSCETKPITGNRSDRVVGCTNKPNSPPCRAGRGHRSERRGRNAPNKPNVGRGTGIPSASLSGQALPESLDHRQDADATVPPGGGTTNLSETRRRLCQTKPIPARQADPRGLEGATVCWHRPAGPAAGQSRCPRRRGGVDSERPTP